MKDKEYRFNHETLKFEAVKRPFRLRIYRLMRKGIFVIIVVCIINLIFSFVFHTPKMKRLARENEDILKKYEVLDDRISEAERRIEAMHERDIYVYRPLFGADTLTVDGIYTPYPDSVYDDLKDAPNSERLISAWKSIDQATRSLYLQSLSLDELQKLASDKERMATAMPAIWPIDRRNLRNNLSSYGRRFHPIYKRYIMHAGLDMPADIGDPVYATANGVVESTSIGLRRRGYGQQILIDHGFGYKTRYAHLSRIDVKPGQQVLRGEQIGCVGNTGGSTGPHLHYEVIYRGRTVNPVNYFRRDMSPEDFEHIIQAARETTYEVME